jgi:phospholysine phosphohistidine inorganic pyrophosphate phosphatase
MTAKPGAFLIDLDGTVYVGDQLVPGARDALLALEASGIPFRYITNTTRRSLTDIVNGLREFGLPATPEHVFTAAGAAVQWLSRARVRTIALYVPDAAQEDFRMFDIADADVEAVVLGDMGSAWTFELLNRAFHQVLSGAQIVALQKNRYWRTPEGLVLDAGPFVAALEYATESRAIVVGKPNAEFFELAAGTLPRTATPVAVVGDDVETDVMGAKAAGLLGVLVRTGKFLPSTLDASEVQPDYILDSIADLPGLAGS